MILLEILLELLGEVFALNADRQATTLPKKY